MVEIVWWCVFSNQRETRGCHWRYIPMFLWHSSCEFDECYKHTWQETMFSLAFINYTFMSGSRILSSSSSLYYTGGERKWTGKNSAPNISRFQFRKKNLTWKILPPHQLTHVKLLCSCNAFGTHDIRTFSTLQICTWSPEERTSAHNHMLCCMWIFNFPFFFL